MAGLVAGVRQACDGHFGQVGRVWQVSAGSVGTKSLGVGECNIPFRTSAWDRQLPRSAAGDSGYGRGSVWIAKEDVVRPWYTT